MTIWSYWVGHKCPESPSDTVRIHPAVDGSQEDKDEPDGNIDLHHVWHVYALGQPHEPADGGDDGLPPETKTKSS